MGAQRHRRQDRRRRRPGQAGAGLVDDEHPVGIAVERQADVEPAGHHPGAQVALVRRLQRVGRVVREGAVELGIHHLELEHAEPVEHGRDDEAAHAVGGVGDDPARAQGVDVDERHDVVDEVGEQVLLGAPPGALRRRRAAPVEDVLGQRLDRSEVDRERRRRGTA